MDRFGTTHYPSGPSDITLLDFFWGAFKDYVYSNDLSTDREVIKERIQQQTNELNESMSRLSLLKWMKLDVEM